MFVIGGDRVPARVVMLEALLCVSVRIAITTDTYASKYPN
jgi:hypothetical protein